MRRTAIAVFLWAAAAGAAVPELEDLGYIQSGGGPLTIAPYTAPSVIDWNNDGRKDLLIGQFDYGYVWLFLNQGADGQPSFVSGQQLRVGTQPITTSYG